MKTLKNTAVRSALALVAAGSLLAATACSAGQVTQTADQVAAVNGVATDVSHLILNDAAIVVDPDNKLAVKVTISNTENEGRQVTLQSITVNGQQATLGGESSVQAGANLVLDYPAAVDALEQQGSTLTNTYGTATIDNGAGLSIGNSATVTVTFDNGESVEVSAPVVGYTPEAGAYYRDETGLTDQTTFESNNGVAGDAAHSEDAAHSDH